MTTFFMIFHFYAVHRTAIVGLDIYDRIIWLEMFMHYVS